MNKLARPLAAALALRLGSAGALAALPQTVDVAAAREASAAGLGVLIDIREPNEHALGIAPGAVTVPLEFDTCGV